MAGDLDIGTLRGQVSLDDQFSNALTALSGKVNSEMNKVGAAFTKAGTALSIGITAPIVAAGVASLNMSGKFEAVTAKLVSLAGVTADRLNDVREAMLEMAPRTGVGPLALAEAMTKVSSTVADTDVALQILEKAAQGSAAGLGAAVDVAGALTAVINSYGAENITAARAADILTKAVQDGGAEAKELAPTLANVVPFAAQLGISFEEVAANIATVTKLGVPAEEAVTQLSAVMTALTKETKQGSEALFSIGMSYAGVRAEIKEKGLSAALTEISQKFGENKTGLADVFGRIEALRNVMSSAGQQAATYAEEIKRINEAAESGTTLAAAFEQMQGKQVQTWAALRAQLDVVAIRLGNALAPAFAQVMVAAQPLLTALVGMVKWFSELPTGIKTTSIALVAAAAAIGPILFMVGGMVTGISSLVGLIPAMGAAFALATGPIGLVVLAVAGLVAAVIHFRNEMAAIENKAPTIKQQMQQQIKEATELPPGFTIGGFGGFGKGGATKTAEAVGGANVVDPEALKAAETAAKELAKRRADIERETALTTTQLATMTPALTAQIEHWLDFGFSVEDVGVKLHLTTITVQKVQDELKKSADAAVAWDKQMNAQAETSRDLAESMRRGVQMSWQQSLNIAKGFTYDGLIPMGVEITNTARKLDAEDIAAQRFAQTHKGLAAAMENTTNITQMMGQTAAAQQKDFENLIKPVVELGKSFRTALAGVPELLIKAFTGGGGLAGAMKAIGVSIADSILTPLMKGLTEAKQRAVSIGTAGAGGLAGAAGLGSTTTALIGTGTAIAGSALAASGMFAATTAGTIALGAATLGIGAAAVGVAVLIKHFLTVSKEIKQARTDLKDFVGEMNKTATAMQVNEAHGQQWALTVIQVRDAYLKTGRTAESAMADVAAMWDTDNPDRMHEAILRVNTAITEQQTLLDQQKQDASDLEAAITKYGFKIEELGPALSRQKMTEQAVALMNDFQLLINAGVGFNTVLDHMGPAINDFVNQSIKAGTEVPSAMKPIIQKMIEAGTLVDANGDQFKDLQSTGLTFSETMTQGFDRVVKAIEKVLVTLGLVAPAVENLPTHFDIVGRVTIPDMPKNDFQYKEEAAGGVGVTHGPTLFLAGVNGPEEYAFSGDNRKLAGGGGGTLIIQTNLDGREVGRVVVPYIPEILRENGVI